MHAIDHLKKLSTDRFALSTLSRHEFNQIHKELLAMIPPNSPSHDLITQSNTTQDWYLFGTDGCHLCHLSHDMLAKARTIHPDMPSIYDIDIIDGDDMLVEVFGKIIPVLLTPKRLLCYPFGVMDIVMLAKN